MKSSQRSGIPDSDAMNVDKNTRDRFKDHPFFPACEEFCGRWDETAFDPNYENLPLSEFRPMLKKILQRYIMVIHIQAETTLKWQNLLSSNDIFLSIF